MDSLTPLTFRGSVVLYLSLPPCTERTDTCLHGEPEFGHMHEDRSFEYGKRSSGQFRIYLEFTLDWWKWPAQSEGSGARSKVEYWALVHWGSHQTFLWHDLVIVLSHLALLSSSPSSPASPASPLNMWIIQYPSNDGSVVTACNQKPWLIQKLPSGHDL